MSAGAQGMRGRGRALGRLNQLFTHLNLLCNANSCDWIELEAKPDLVLLKRAIEHVIDRHPMARSIRYRRGLGYGWRHLDRRLPIELEERESTLTDPIALRAQLLKNAWDRRVPEEDGHPFRFFYTRTPDRHVLQIITTHIYTDGKAANLFSGDIAETYGRLVAGQPLDHGMIDLPERDHDRLFLAGLSPLRRLGLFWRGMTGFLRDLMRPAGRLAFDRVPSGDTDVLMQELPAHLFEGLKRQCAMRDITLHPLLLLAVLRTCERDAEIQGSPLRHPMRIVDNFSLRRFVIAPAMERLYDCVSVPYTMTIDHRQDDDAVLKGFFEDIEALKQGEILRELYRLRLLFWSTAPLPKAPMMRMACDALRANVICTNVGVIDKRLESFGPVAVRSYYSFPQLLPPGELMYQISSFRGRLRLLVLYDRGQMDEAAARRRFIDPFLGYLERLAAQPSVAAPEPVAAY